MIVLSSAAEVSAENLSLTYEWRKDLIDYIIVRYCRELEGNHRKAGKHKFSMHKKLNY